MHKIGVNEGQTVTQGTELFVLRSDEIRGIDAQLRSAQEDLRTQEEDLAKADAAYMSQMDIKLAEISQAESEVKFRQKHAATNRELVSRMEKLSKEGGISGVELIRLRLTAAESEKDESVAERTLQQVRLEQKRMETEHSRQRSEKLGNIEKIKYRLAPTKAISRTREQDLLSIRAPYDAVVISLAQRSAGTVVQNGQELCQLARAEAQPHARLTIKESGFRGSPLDNARGSSSMRFRINATAPSTRKLIGLAHRLSRRRKGRGSLRLLRSRRRARRNANSRCRCASACAAQRGSWSVNAR